jgi:hypothetical protein
MGETDDTTPLSYLHRDAANAQNFTAASVKE